LREQFEGGRRRGLEAEAVERLFEAAPELVPPEAAAEGGLAVGERARHAQLGWEGVIEKLEPGRAEVAVRGKRIRCRPEDLVPLSGTAVRPAERERERTLGRGGVRAETAESESAEAPAEVNLIGQRVEPALEVLDAYIDQALLSSRKEVRVIHGHGTGRLRQAVREHLRSHRGVSQLRSGAPNEGGDGATVVTLRGG
jgi:DNA mismatch repair protein MutS2